MNGKTDNEGLRESDMKSPAWNRSDTQKSEIFSESQEEWPDRCEGERMNELDYSEDSGSLQVRPTLTKSGSVGEMTSEKTPTGENVLKIRCEFVGGYVGLARGYERGDR